ncbi:flavin-dependent monooxygenase [Acinetobacter nosocomialis]|uniref:acyl-CoA dehydrogenase family protein n=1 Tax=Acinetobacter nosocomialis TaxID=106654 RepID=UPI00233FD2B7|nr:acyl-CoA dehydrogenase family protein [Acinetobacter nosocomialis]MDC4142677.1 flavin-dependent monooxygenase [Acinetobacter nosocomialis]
MYTIERLYDSIFLDESKKSEFEELLKQVALESASFSELAFIPQHIVDLMKKAGFFRVSVPRIFGGNAGNPLPFLQSLEKLAAVDGSAAWVASFGSSNYYLAALPIETQKIIYQDGPDQIFAGGLFPVQPVTRIDNGWEVSGTWKFSSGSKTADWLGVGICESSSGEFQDLPRTVIFPKDKVQVSENWDVFGMEGTGSHDLKVNKEFVTEDWSFIRGAPALVDEPLYHIPTVAFSGQVHTVVALGLAYAAIQELLQICKGQTTTGAPKLADRAYFRMALSKNTAAFLSVRSYFYEICHLVWAEIEKGNEISKELENEMRLSATYAAHSCVDIVKNCYSISGINSIFKRQKMQKILRDILVITQHAHINESVFDGAGAVMTKTEPFKGYI